MRVGVPSATGSGGALYLVVSNDAAFDAGDVWVPMAPFTPDGIATYLATDTDFVSGQYFTFATVPPLDLGDAPASYGTLLANDGARHGVPGYNAGANTAQLMLGALIDLEADGAASASATGDDAAGVDDEDGVTFAPLVAGLAANLSVTVANSGSAARLSAWADWNNNGTFEAGEQIVTNLAVVAGPNTIPIAVPATAGGLTNVRVRLSTQSGLGPTGVAPDGEVEDYQVLVASVTDLAITKTDNQTSYVPGAAISYTIVVTNAGPSLAAGVTVSDIVPPAIGGVTATCSAAGTASCGTNSSSGNNVSFTGASLAAGAGSQLTVTITGIVDPPTTSDLVNTATVAAASDPNAANNSATDTDSRTPTSDIVLSKTVDQVTPTVGTVVTFTITASNRGPSDATGVLVIDQLPSGLALISATASQGSYERETGFWRVGAIANGASATLQLAARVGVPARLVNIATKTSGDQFDPDASNNAAGVALTAAPAADVQVHVTADRSAVNVGATVTITVTLRNAGPSEATAVLTQIALASGLSVVAAPDAAGAAAPLTATPSAGTFDPATNRWTVGVLPSGATATLVLVSTITAAGPQRMNATKIAQTEFDPVVPNDASGVVVNGLAADVQLVKTATAQFAAVGQRVGFTIVATNNGPSAATAVVVRDVLPAGLAFINAVATQGTFDPVSGSWTVGTLSAFGPASGAILQLDATVVATGLVSNTTIVAGLNEPDTNPANNTSGVVLQSDTSDLAAGLSFVGAPGQVGTTVRFLVDIVNVGGATSTGRITFTLSLPPELVYAAGPAGWDCTPSGQTVSCARDDLPIPSGVLAQPVVLVQVAALLGAPTFVHLAIANEVDVNPANNVALVRVDATLVIDPADLRITQSLTPSAGARGQEFELVADIGNRGPDPASDLVSLHAIPDGLTVTGMKASAGSCRGTALVTCTFGRVPSGGQVRVTIRVRADAAGVYRLVSSVTSLEDDPRLTDNQIATPLTVSGEPPPGGTPPGGSRPPFGYVDLPADGALVSGVIALGGWALDDVRVARVRIYRDPVAPEAPGALVFVGDAVSVRGARPDVERAFTAMPYADEAGWGLLVLTNMLPNRGTGNFRLHAIAEDGDGQQSLLGSRSVVGDNVSATKPFGTIDTPAWGETIGGTFLNFGWALTPLPKAIPVDGSTITVLIDGQPVGTVAYNHFRSDIAGLFPDYANANGAVGYRAIDTSQLAAGLHTISWSVSDDAGVTEGIGSRYFRVAERLSSRRSSASVSGARPPSVAEGAPPVLTRELARLEIALADLDAAPQCAASRYEGFEEVSGQRRPLPVGSTLDAGRGVFMWEPGAGFVGKYRLVFARRGCDGLPVEVPVDVIIERRIAR